MNVTVVILVRIAKEAIPDSLAFAKISWPHTPSLICQMVSLDINLLGGSVVIDMMGGNPLTHKGRRNELDHAGCFCHAESERNQLVE